ncbi:hypothetical protein M422DRAFT_260353 [Sphaerobolus stellatus SS14]|uniref:Uncharacterized protein n=1 Tax=Sphaerobolus stellatus (strain SS14) TaxID=990650 RepID=A0A0C9UQZ6_SPHS4|nr:hypothetical protein M422DRAFT_260353 [Sphaerobolus stellatus SS14]
MTILVSRRAQRQHSSGDRRAKLRRQGVSRGRPPRRRALCQTQRPRRSAINRTAAIPARSPRVAHRVPGRHTQLDPHPLAERNHRLPLPGLHDVDDISTDDKPSVDTNVNEPRPPRGHTCYSHFIALALAPHFSTSSTSNLRRSQSQGKAPSTASTTATSVSSVPSSRSPSPAPFVTRPKAPTTPVDLDSAGASGATSSSTHAPTPAPTFAPGIPLCPPPPLPSRRGSVTP